MLIARGRKILRSLAATRHGIGARLLSGSYYGQTVQIWSALTMAAIMASLLIAVIALAERLTLNAMGARP